MNIKRIVMGVGMAGLTLTLSAADYTWNGPADGLFSEPSNWLVGDAVATAAPGASDTVTIPTGSSIDLAGGNWASRWNPAGVKVSLVNGTWKAPVGGNFAKGATLNFGADAVVELSNSNGGVWWGHQAETTTFNVENGANLALKGSMLFDQVTVNVKAGGVFTHDALVTLCCGRGDREYRIYVEKDGVASFPNGFRTIDSK